MLNCLYFSSVKTSILRIFHSHGDVVEGMECRLALMTFEYN